MKKPTKFLICLIPLVVLATELYCQIPAFEEREYKIDLNESFISPEEAGEKLRCFLERFRASTPSGIKSVSVSGETIEMPAFYYLYKKADDAAKNYYSNLPNEKYVTGVEIHYGLSPDTTIELYYQPWFLDVNERDRKKISGKKKLVDIYKFYKYDEGNYEFKEESNDYVFLSLHRYIRQMRIEHRKKWGSDSVHSLGSKRDTWKSDSKSVHFTFQQLYNLSWANDSTAIVSFEGAKFRRRHKMNFFNLKRTKQTSMFMCENCYLSFLGTLEDFDSDSSRKILENMPEDGQIANLAHLCPPSCDDLEYPIDQQ